MTCIKMGSDESHFNVSLTARDKVTRPCPQTATSEEKGEAKRYRTKVLYRLTRLGQTGSQHSRSLPWTYRYIYRSMVFTNLQAPVYDILPLTTVTTTPTWYNWLRHTGLPKPSAIISAPKTSLNTTTRPESPTVTLRVQELCESRGGRPRLQSLTSLRFLWT